MLVLTQSRMTTLVVMGAILLSFTAISGAENTDPILLVGLTDTTAQVGADAWVSVYLANYQDTLAGFSLYVVADQPDIIQFQTDPDDPVLTPGGVDTAGTAISGWQYVGANSFSAGRTDIKVTAMANVAGPPYQPGLLPQETPVLLMRLKVRVADELPFATDSVVILHIEKSLQLTAFSDPSGDLIGTVANYNICDTTYWCCVEWSGDTCLGWTPCDPILADSIYIDTFSTYWCCDEWSGDTCMGWTVCLPPGDSVEIHHQPWTSLDTSAVFYVDGEFRVVPDFCCNFPGDMNGDEMVNVTDPVFLINHIFRNGPPPSCPQAADVNGDCMINIGDVLGVLRPIFNIDPWEPLECAPDSCVYFGY